LNQLLRASANLLAGIIITYLGINAIKEPLPIIIIMCGCIVFAFFINQLRFYVAAITTLSYVLFFHVILFNLYAYSFENIFLTSLSIWFFQVASMAGGYMIEKNRRKVFVQNIIINDQHEIIMEEKTKSKDLFNQKLIHTEKLAAIGSAVAGVAHEVNNPNNSLMLDIETMRKIFGGVLPILNERLADCPDAEIVGFPYGELKKEITALTDRMKRNSERIKRIVMDLRSFAKNEVIMSEDVVINGVVDAALTVADHVITKCTKNFHFDPGEDIPTIKGNVQYMEQLVINLVKNACQALPDFEKGVWVSTVFDKKTNRIVLTVRDDGAGMDDETLKNLFTPFYTTKGKEGTGLGLSICNNIAKIHGGKIEVKSKVHEGTTISVILPVSSVA
jgi:signal transduction histidine kinase